VPHYVDPATTSLVQTARALGINLGDADDEQ